LTAAKPGLRRWLVASGVPPVVQRLLCALVLLGLLAVAAAPRSALAAVETEPSLGSVRFAPGGTQLPAAARPLLDRAAAHLGSDDKARLELIAYASGSNQNSRARRLSLDRAIAVRAYLADRGVPATRVLLRALGNRHAAGDGDCVELVALE
jgi:outer membrane protein OmpA-like peptidoglycan-associated protein